MSADSSDDPIVEPWSYRNTLVLAPMVRINTLPFRLLAREFGAGIVYSEELVDRSVQQCRRSENAALGTVEFRHHDSGKLIFSTVPHERVAFQLGTASAVEALKAAEVVVKDVRAIDVNMGCPIKFSTMGGMGAALLSRPEVIKDILTTLVRNLGHAVPITCKIRLLDTPQETLQLARIIQDTGVSALAVHARRRADRPRWWAQWDQVALLRQQLGTTTLPLIPNGDVFLPEHVPLAREATGCDSLMIARGAMWNASIFDQSSPRLRAQRDVFARYVELCAQYDNPFGNSKHVAMEMLAGHGKTEAYKLLQRATDYAGLRTAVDAMAGDAAFDGGAARVPMALEPAPDLGRDAVANPVNAWRTLPPHCRGLLAPEAATPAAAADDDDAAAAAPADGSGPKRSGAPQPDTFTGVALGRSGAKRPKGGAKLVRSAEDIEALRAERAAKKVAAAAAAAAGSDAAPTPAATAQDDGKQQGKRSIDEMGASAGDE